MTHFIPFHVYFQRMEYEKKAKHCVTHLKEKMDTIAVKSNKLASYRRIFDQYMDIGEDQVREALLQKIFLFYWPIEERDADINHSKILVDLPTLTKLKNTKGNALAKLEEEKAKEAARNERKKKKKFRVCCKWCYESDSDSEEEEEKKEEEAIVDVEPEEHKLMEDQIDYQNVDFGVLLMNLQNGGFEQAKNQEFYINPYNYLNDRTV